MEHPNLDDAPDVVMKSVCGGHRVIIVMLTCCLGRSLRIYGWRGSANDGRGRYHDTNWVSELSISLRCMNPDRI
jgi:hypothetical protein